MPVTVGQETGSQGFVSSQASGSEDLLTRMLEAAESAIGVQYRWGGNSLASGVDCSGLVQQAFRAAGIMMPRVSASQARTGLAVGLDDLKPGDLVWADNSARNNGADHISIYVGNGMVIEAPRRGAPVRVVPMAGRTWSGATRVIGVIPPLGNMPAPSLGPNADRRYTMLAVAEARGEQPPAVAPTDTPGSGEQAQIFAAGGGLGDDLPQDASEDQIVAYLRTHYPDVAPFLQNDEIRGLVLNAVKDGAIENPNEFLHRFRQTDYFRDNSPESRDFDALLGTDRAAAVKAINGAKEIVGDAASRAGLSLDDRQIGEAAKNALCHGFVSFDDAGNTGVGDQDGLSEWVAGGLRFQREEGEGFGAGEASLSADAIVALGRNYLVPITRRTAEDWALRIMDGSMSKETVEAQIRGQAKANFAKNTDLTAAIDQGWTPADYFAGHVATVAGTLELDEKQIDLLDPKWSWITESVDAKGERHVPTRGEVARAARARPEFANTDQYRQQGASMASSLVDFFYGGQG